MQKIKASTIIIYLAGWLLFLSFPLVFINGARSNGNIFSLVSNSYYWLFCACYIVLFYLNSLYLIPAFITIAPLILMTFVENMFKHGISKQKEYLLKIEVVIEEKSVSFFSQTQLLII